MVALLCLAAGVAAQGSVSGRVTADPDGRPLANAAVIIGEARGVTTDRDGRFTIDRVAAGIYTLEVRMLGYHTHSQMVEVSDGATVTVTPHLAEEYIDAGEVVVTANRGASRVADVPSRVTLIGAAAIASRPVTSVDEILSTIPGLNISRSFGIFSHKSSVTMRGLSGNEQARVLVMIDGVPVNKSDGGSVNWNLLDPAMVERIEVVKGPASSMYGSNAMGGAINIITRRPSAGLSGRVYASYGTYNTLAGRVNLSQSLDNGRGKGFYYMINGLYRQSDGYITQTEAERAANPYIVNSDMMEFSGSLKAGYNIREGEYVEADFILYDDRRGTGELVWQPYGNTTDHDTYQFRTRYSVEREKMAADVSLFWLHEDYKKVNEYLKDDYTWYKVLSARADAGMLSSLTLKVGERHTVTAGTDLKVGSVDASDIYYTSTDIIYNRGRMVSAGLYLQDALILVPERLTVTAGLRYDLSMFRDGAFYIETPSAETSFMEDIVNRDMDNTLWGALSPRLALNYTLSPGNRIYLSAGRGFRPAVLDDLCRSGRIRGGFKLASAEATPEHLTNLEAGTDLSPGGMMKISLSAWYSRGTDFLYYVSRGDSIEMGYGLRPVFVRANIPLVEIAGLEGEISYPVLPSLSLGASGSYTHSVITEYRPGSPSDPVDLTGKFLTGVPSTTVSLSARWSNRFVNAGVVIRYQGAMWANDQNLYDEVVGSDRYPAYTTVDVRLSREFLDKIGVDLGMQNLLDTKFYDSKGYVCPGRFITLGAYYRF